MSLNFSEIKVDIGDSIQLQDPSNKNDDRIFVKLIGYLEEKSLIVTMPRTNGDLVRVVKGQIFIVRMFSVKTVHAFNVTVIESKASPYPHLHLTYPDKVESVVVRNAQRVNVGLIVSVQSADPDDDTGSVSAKLTDISTGGAKLISFVDIGNTGEDISMSAKLRVGGVEQYMQILATIRRVETEDINGTKSNAYGLEFRFVEEKDRLALHAFVYEQLSKQ